MSVESRVRRWVGQCLRKVRMSEGHASAVIRRAKEGGQVLYKYRCPHCQSWHVTKLPQGPNGMR